MHRTHVTIVSATTLALLALGLSSGCNTVKGVGKDRQSVGAKAEQVNTGSTTRPAR